MKVDLIQTMGSDLTVVNAARVSFAKESQLDCPEGNNCCGQPGCYGKLADKDQRLIRFLARNNHWTPFGHCSATFRISAPIFVARQLGKHQVGLVWNEVSRRYVDDTPEFYEPTEWRKKAADKKQGSSDEVVTSYTAARERSLGVTTTPQDEYEELLCLAEHVYCDMLDAGICPEQARMVLPQSMMTEWYWTGSLAAFARVANLRLKPDTQAETRVVADLISKPLAAAFPHSWAALTEKV